MSTETGHSDGSALSRGPSEVPSAGGDAQAACPAPLSPGADLLWERWNHADAQRTRGLRATRCKREEWKERRKEQLVSDASLLWQSLQVFAQMGYVSSYQTEDILPEHGREADLKTVSLGSATRVVKTVLSPGTNTSG